MGGGGGEGGKGSNNELFHVLHEEISSYSFIKHMRIGHFHFRQNMQ